MLLAWIAAITATAVQGFVFEPGPGPGRGKNVVLIAADDEYYSEESLPRLAAILAKRHGFRCRVLFGINPKDGTIEAGAMNIPGLEALDRADLMILFTRFRNLPDAQMKHIVEYVESGRPVFGIRTATHAFRYPADSPSPYRKWSWDSKEPGWVDGFGKVVLGETWVSHHGDHGSQSTRGLVTQEAAGNPIVRGVVSGEIWGETDVYTIRLPLPPDATTLVVGSVLAGMKPTDPAVEGPKNDPMMPIAWTRLRPVGGGKTQRVFASTIGGSMSGGSDLNSEALRRLFVNAVYWCVGLESRIPAKANADDVLVPNPFRRGVRPGDVRLP